MIQVHHVGLCPADVAESLRFYVEGIGLTVLFDVVLPVDLEPLLGTVTDRPRTIFLGDESDPDRGVLELLDLGTDAVAGEEPARGLPHRGAFLVSFQVPVRATLDRLAALGLGGTPRVMPTPSGGIVATVVDPDGVMVELMDGPVTIGG
ncbi:VOC family protein [Actinocorallia sp. A-T 12471]|uniref:VOC family protein n=1 Tax=Actinocorallia sp. A-T 12471 TaxID=3089813 RepID=UPI0029CCFADA|nr:VOC family protein [Actinocorallia sp. A-T 12471]MDX6741467.1 VOC family protein [Actinocorallia sp. A-T 12471]